MKHGLFQIKETGFTKCGRSYIALYNTWYASVLQDVSLGVIAYVPTMYNIILFKGLMYTVNRVYNEQKCIYQFMYECLKTNS